MSYSFTDSPETYSFDDGLSPAPTEQVTNQRAVKTDYALGKDSPGAVNIASAISSGNEGELRQQVAQSETVKREAARTDLIKQVAQTAQSAVTPEDVALIRQASALDLRADPSTIFEQAVADRYAKDTLSIKADNSQSVFNRFGYFNPPAASRDVDVFAGVVQSMEYEKNQLENLHGEWSKTSWATAVPQYIGQVVPLLSAYRLHNVLQAAPTSTLLPGDNLGQQISYLKACLLLSGRRRMMLR
jgi:hypothetical protein